MSRPILNVADVEFRDWGHGAGAPGAEHPPEQFQARLGDIGRRLGAQKLGHNVTAVPPGKRAFPFHNHRVNEEMFFVLAGEGEAASARNAMRSGRATSSRVRRAGSSIRRRSSCAISR